jgi:hypothetical protein
MSDDLLEERLRRALDARARQITPERLQPAVPPTSAVPVRPWSWPRSWRSVLVAAALTAAAVLAIWRPVLRVDPAPTLPPAGPVQPSPSPASSRATPSGSATPSPAPSDSQQTPGIGATPPASGRPKTSDSPSPLRAVTGPPSGSGPPVSPSARSGSPPASRGSATHPSATAT